jgi:hypothetical protein
MAEIGHNLKRRHLKPSVRKSLVKLSLPTLILSSFVAVSLSACSDYALPTSVSPITMQAGQLQLGNFDQGLGQNLAQYAINNTSGGTGYCYQYVASSIHAHVPAFLSGLHAYMAADQLASSPYFKEVGLASEQLALLPAGAVVVWSQGSSESGHISIADGQGHEISDHIAPQMQAHYGGGAYRVFLPVNP